MMLILRDGPHPKFEIRTIIAINKVFSTDQAYRGMIYTVLTVSALAIGTVVVMAFLQRKNHFDVKDHMVIVTGGSQGLGLSVAKQLAMKGANVVIVAQTVSKLENALEEINTASKKAQKCYYLSYDLRSPDTGPKIIEEVTKLNNGNPPDVVFNCAGHCEPGFFASSSIEQHRNQMDTVYWTSAYMAHAILQAWTKPAERVNRTRHLIFTSSVVALFPFAGYACYSPGKAAMRSLADTLNQEVEVYNGAWSNQSQKGPAAEIKVHISFPMGIMSPGYDNEQKTKPKLTQMLEESDRPDAPDELAKSLIADLEAGKFMMTSQSIGHIMLGWAMGASQRTSIADYLWSWLGSIVVLFVAPDFMSKCRKWGQEKGLNGAY